MVELDAILKDLDPWPDVAAIVNMVLKKDGLTGFTVILRAASGQEQLGLDGGVAFKAVHDGRLFEFAFDVTIREDAPPGLLPDLETWAELIIIDRIQQYLRSTENNKNDDGLLI